jgi:hypothetical protein
MKMPANGIDKFTAITAPVPDKQGYPTTRSPSSKA